MTLIPQSSIAGLQDCWENGRNLKENFGRIGNNVTKELEVFNLRISPMVVFPEIAPWKMTWPEVDWFVLEEKRKSKKEVNLKSIFNNRIGGNYSEFIQIYTDGAKKKLRQKKQGLGWQFGLYTEGYPPRRNRDCVPEPVFFFPLLPNQIILFQLLKLFSFVCNGKVIIYVLVFYKVNLEKRLEHFFLFIK